MPRKVLMNYSKKFFTLSFMFSSILASQEKEIVQEKKPHILVQAGIPGIRQLYAFRPETCKPLREIAQILLVNDSDLTRAEREIIAAYVSYLNQCNFCCSCHTAIAVELLDGRDDILQAVKQDFITAPISDKLKALLTIAAKVQKDARTVGDQDVIAARKHGATDLEIHDTVLISALFCLYNKYVDGLGAWTPDDQLVYDKIGVQVAATGYIRPAGQ